MDLQIALPVLLSWAVHLSDYSEPVQPPQLQYRPHAFFVQEVCGGRECKAVGWYNDQDVVYIDERLRYSETSFARSLLVHELIHYLQHHSGGFDSRSCEDSIAREREAYSVQNSYLLSAQASINQIRPAPVICAYETSTAGNSGWLMLAPLHAAGTPNLKLGAPVAYRIPARRQRLTTCVARHPMTRRML